MPRRTELDQIHPGEICLIMATRGRPESLAQVFKALKANTAKKEKVSLWLYVDEDDLGFGRVAGLSRRPRIQHGVLISLPHGILALLPARDEELDESERGAHVHEDGEPSAASVIVRARCASIRYALCTQ